MAYAAEMGLPALPHDGRAGRIAARGPEATAVAPRWRAAQQAGAGQRHSTRSVVVIGPLHQQAGGERLRGDGHVLGGGCSVGRRRSGHRYTPCMHWMQAWASRRRTAVVAPGGGNAARAARTAKAAHDGRVPGQRRALLVGMWDAGAMAPYGDAGNGVQRGMVETMGGSGGSGRRMWARGGRDELLVKPGPPGSPRER